MDEETRVPNWWDIANLSNNHSTRIRVVGRANGVRLLNERARLNKTAVRPTIHQKYRCAR